MAKYKATYSVIYEIEGELTEDDMKLIAERFREWLVEMGEWIADSFGEFIIPRLEGKVDEWDVHSKVMVEDTDRGVHIER